MPDVRSRRVAAWEWLSSSYGRLRDWGGEARRWQLGSAYAYLVHSRLRRDALGNCTRELWRARRAIERDSRFGSLRPPSPGPFLYGFIVFLAPQRIRIGA